MAETEEETETTDETPAVEETPVPVGVVYYLVRSIIRGRANRTARASQPGRRGFVQRLAGGSIIVRRARPARVTEAVLKANLEELKKANAEQRVEVTTLQGQLVNLDTLEVKPLVASKPLPNPPLDSAKNDRNQNIGYKVPPNPTGTPLDAEKPALLQKGSLLELPSDASLETTPETPAAEPVTEPAAEVQEESPPLVQEPGPAEVSEPAKPSLLSEPTAKPSAQHHHQQGSHKKGRR